MNDNSRRGKIQIYADILKVIKTSNGRIKKTHIVYKANLTHSRLNNYLELLLEKGFIAEEKIGAGIFYKITERGIKFLGDMTKLKEISTAFGFPV